MRKSGIVLLVLMFSLVASGVSAQTETGEAFITINLSAGFPLDPLVLSVNGGGAVDASALNPDCVGYIHTSPTVQVNWTGESAFLRAFIYSDHDSVLVAQTPDGSYLCNDDFSPLMLDASLEVEAPQPGLYSIWVGTFAPEQLIPGFLVFTANPQVSVSSFDLESLVQREPVAEVPSDAILYNVDTLQLFGSASALNLTLAAGDAPLAEAVTVSGIVPLFDLDHGNPACTGFVDSVPTLAVTWSGTAYALHFFFESDHDTTLLVVTPEGDFVCNDDTAGIDNLNPTVRVSNPTEGDYLVFVGRFDPLYEVSGTLTVTDSDAVESAALSVTLPEAIEPPAATEDSE